jgi:flavorubredoxin/rubredoxin
MQGSTVKTYFATKMAIDPKQIVHVAVTPCTAKKFEIRRDEMNAASKKLNIEGMRDTDYVITSRELAKWIKEECVDFNFLLDSDYDKLMGTGSGSGVIFGNTGGVMEAAVRTTYFMATGQSFSNERLNLQPVRGMDGIRSATLNIAGVSIKVAVAHGIDNAKQIVESVVSGTCEYDFIEVMSCRGGCIGGGGQPKTEVPMSDNTLKSRMSALYKKDSDMSLRCSHDNPEIKEVYKTLYEKPGSAVAEQLLHTSYVDRSDDLGSEGMVDKSLTSTPKYRCALCGYIHTGVISEKFTCPMCGVSKDDFFGRKFGSKRGTMSCTKKITEDLIWVGANDRRLGIFESVYNVPNGVSYNSYLLLDEKTVLMDTVDRAVQDKFLENVEVTLAGRDLDYFVVQHMEPDHSAVTKQVLQQYPNAKLVCNGITLQYIKQFFDFDADSRVHLVKEGDSLSTGRHLLHFVFAPMVHWPEVMVTYDSTDKILFSADGFGCFGALNGAIFADEVDFSRDYMDEARRYYTNIVGKYGPYVEELLDKASSLEIKMICPLHGFVWRKDLGDFISKYVQWCTYEPEEQGVMIAYASVYGNTEQAAEILSSRLRDKGIKTQMFDVSFTAGSDIISACFKWSHLVFATTTYNSGIFVTMDALLNDLVAHNIQNRTVFAIENGTWSPFSGDLVYKKFEQCEDIHFPKNMISIKSSLRIEQLSEIDAMVEAIRDTLPESAGGTIMD